MDRENCIFCQIIARQNPASIIYEDEMSLVFLDLFPVTPGHMLVIPKNHNILFIDLPTEEAAHLLIVGQKMDTALRHSGLECEGVSLVLSDGKAAGQEVKHVHLHVFPRFQGDGVYSCLDPAARTHPDRSFLDYVAQTIRLSLA